jgi:uncharacterized membrane protein YqjE
MPDRDSPPVPTRPGLGPRALLASTLGLLATHVELAGIELLEEKERLKELAVVGAIAIVGLGMALLALSALLVAAFWDNNRLLVLGLLALGYFILGVWALRAFRSRIAAHVNPFAITVAELHKDRERLQHRQQ